MQKFKISLIKFSIAFFVFLFLFFIQIKNAEAATKTWSGATNGNWSVGTNWGGTAPVTGDDLVFPSGASNLSNTNDLTENTIINSITFTGSGYTLSGNPLILGQGLAGITDSVSSGGNTIALDMRFEATRDIIVSNTAESLTISGRITGVGGLNKEGTGTLILSGANTYGGTTKINVGVLNARNSTALGTIAAGTEVVGGAALELQGTIDISYEALALRGYGVNGGGALRNISDSNTYAGLITLSSAGGTEISSDSGTLTLKGGITGTFPLVIDGAGNVTFSTTPIAISTGTLTKNGAGTLTFNFPNTYTGLTTVNAGTLLYGVDNAILSGAITVTGGTLDIATFSDMVGTVTLGTTDLASGTITGSTGILSSATYTVYSGTISAIIAGDVPGGTTQLTKSTVGTVTLTRPNQYTGATSITLGVLKIQNSTALGTIDGATTVTAGATLQIDGSGLSVPEYITFSGTGHLYSGAILNSTGNNTLTGLLTLGAAALINANTSTTLTVDTKGLSATTLGLSIGGAGNTTFTSTAPIYGTTATLTKNDTGLLTIQSFCNITGATVINKGEIILNSAGAIPLSTTMTINAGASLTLNNTSSASVVDRIADSLALTMNGGNFNFIGSSSIATDETAGALTSGIATQSGHNVITITPGSGGSTTMQFASLTRTAGSSLLFRGTSFGATPAANVSTLLFTTAPTLTGGAGLENSTTISIIAGAIGDDSLSGTGTDMVTYGRGNSNGLRLLNGAGFSGEYASNFATTNANVKLTASTAALTSSVNSIVLSGSGSISNPGSGQVITLASGNILNTVSGATIDGANTTIAGGSVELQVFAPSNITISSLITTTGGLTKSGAGTLTFSTSKTYTGLTSVNGGTLLYGINDSISSGNITVNGGTLDIATYTDTVGAVILQNGTITGSSGVLTGTSYNFREGTVSAIIAGAVAVTRIATNTASDSVVTLTRDNTYTGATTITSGILRLGGAGGGTNTPLGTTGTGTTVSSGAALDLNGYTLGTAEGLTINGLGYGPGTTVANGNSNMGALMNSSSTPVSYSGAITLGAASRINSDYGAMTISSAISGAFTLTIGGFSSTELSGVIGSGAVAVTKDGIGDLTLSNGNSSYTGATTISVGTLKLGAVSVGGTNSPLGTTGGATVISTGARLDLNGYSLGIAEPITNINGGGYGLGDFASGALINSSASAVAFTGAITLGAASTIKANSGDITLSGAVSGAFGLTIAGTGTGTISGLVGISSGTITKIDTGTWTLSNAGNTYTGTTTINNGTLKLGAAGGATNTPLGTTTGSTSVLSGGVLDLNGYTLGTAEVLTINGRGINDSGSLINSGGAVTFAGSITQATDSRIANNGSGLMTLSGAIVGAFALYVGGSADITFGVAVSTAGLSIIKQGADILTVTGANTYTGQTRVDAGTFAYASTTTLGSTNLIVLGGTFDNTNNIDTIGTVTLVGGTINNSVALTGTSYTFENGTINGILAGAVAVTKNTNNTVRLTGVNTISSTVTINAGTLMISGSGSAVSVTAITVNLGGTLTLDNSTTAVASRILDTLVLTMNGGNFSFIGNSGSASSETIGQFAFASGHNVVTITPGAGGSTTFTAASNPGFNRSAGATVLFRGTSFGSTPAANVSTLMFSTAPTLTGAGGSANSTTISIIKGAFGDSSLSGTGSDMVTYNVGNTNGLRLLNGAGFSGEYSATLTTNTNVKLTGNTTASTVSINSLVLNGFGITDAGSARTITIGGASLAANILMNSATDIAGANTTISFSTVELSVLSTNTSTISAILNTAASGPFILSGSGNVTLSAANAYTGITYINNATLTASANDVISSGGVTIVGGTYNLNGNSDTVGAISINAGNITTAAGTLTGNGSFTTIANNNVASIITGNLGLGANATFTIGNGLMDNDAVISAVISGAFTFAKSGSGVLELSSSNTYTGATTISGGTLRLGATGGATNTPLGTTAAGTTVSSGFSLDLNGYTLGTSEALTISGTGISTRGALMNTSSNAVTYSGLITLGAAASIYADYGTMTLSNTGSMTGTGFALTLRGAGNGSLATQINTSTAGSLVKNDLGTWTISGDGNYTGVTTITAGTLKLGAAGGSTNNPFGTVAGATTVSSGAILDLNGFTPGTAEPITISGTGIAGVGAFINTSNNSISYNGAITLGAAVRMANYGSGVLTLTGAISGNFALTTVTVGGITQSSASVWSGSGTLIKEGSGTLILAGQNTMTGAMTVSTGKLQLGASGGATNTPLGTNAGGVTVSSGAVLDLSTFNLGGASTYETLNLSGTGINNGGALISSASSGTTNFGAMTVTANSRVINGAAGTIAFTGTVTIANTINLGIGGTGPTKISGVFGASATTATLTKWDAGTLTISAVAVTTGLVRVNGGTLKYGIADALATPAVTIAGGSWDLGGFSEGGTTLIGAVTLIDGSIVNTGGAATIASSATYTVENGTISAVLAGGAIAFNKNTGGTVTLSAANTFTGLTTINAGILSWGINDALSSGSLTITGGFADLTTRTDTVATVTLTSGGITSSTGILTGTSYAFASGTVSAILAGAVNLSKTTAGTVTMSGTNTYSGTTTITAGTLRSTSSAGLGDGSGTNTLIFGGGTLQAGGDISSPSGRSITLTTTPTVDTNGYTVTFAGTIGSAAGLTKNGTGTLTISGATTLGGALAVNNGTLSQGSSLNMTSGAVTVASSGVWSNVGTGAVTLSGTVTNSGTITLNSNNSAYCVNGTDSILVRSSVNNTTRNWTSGSTGVGTFNLFNLDVDDMTESGDTANAINVYNSTLSGDTTWTVGTCSNFSVAGTANGNNAATVKVAFNGNVQAQTGSISGGAWTISSLASPSVNDIITVWVDNVTDANESTAVTKWSTGNITGLVLNTNVLTIGSNQNTSVSLTNLGLCDTDTGCSDEDIMHTSNSGTLLVQSASNTYTGETLSVLASNTLTVATTEVITTEKISNAGTITPSGTTTFYVNGTSGTLITNTGTFTMTGSTVVLDGDGSATVNTSTLAFNNLTSSGTGTKTLGAAISLASSGVLSVTDGTFDPSTYLITGSGTNTLSVGAGATINVGASTFTGNYSAGFTTLTLNATSTVNYNASGTQTIDGTISYGNLNTGGTGVKTLSFSGSFWSYRKTITINHTVVSNANQTDFPLLVYLSSDSDLASHAQTDGDDIKFTDSNGTQLAHEIETYNSSTGELIAWVKISSLSASVDTTLYMYYGNSGASNQQNPTGVWNSSFKGVWHLPDGTTLGALDSTSNNIDGTITTPTATSGKTDGAGSFNGTSDRIYLGQTDVIRTNGSISGWVYITGTPDANFGTVFASDISTGLGSTPYVRFYVNPDRTLRLTLGSNNSFQTITGSTTLSLNTWYHVSTSISGNGSSSTINIYVNGVSDATQVSGSHDSIDVANKYTSIGALDYLHSNSTWLGFTQGKIDEVRVSNSVRDANWFKTEYNNTNNPASYQTVGGETPQSNLTLSGNLTIGSGSTFDPTSSYSIVGSGTNTLTINGTARVQSSTFAGSYTSFETITPNSGSVVDYYLNGTQTVDSAIAYDGLAVSTGGTKTLGGSRAITGNMTVGSGATFDPSSYTLTGTGTNTLDVTGTLYVTGTNFTDSYASFETKTFNAGSTVNYGASAVQNIDNSLSYVNLATSGSGVKTLVGNTTITGNATIGASTTLDPTSSYTFIGSGTNSITNNGIIRVQHSTFAGTYPSWETKTLTGGTVDYYLGGTQTVDSSLSYGGVTISTSGIKSLDGALSATGTITLAGGTFSSGNHYTINANDITMTGGSFTPGNALINLSGTGTVFNYSSGTYTRSGETINITDSSATAKTFAGGGQSFWTLNFTGTGSGALTISGSNTFNKLKITNPPHTIKFTAGTTQNVKYPELSGISGSLNTLNSSTNGQTWTIYFTPTSTGEGNFEQEFISLRDSTATGNASFVLAYASNSTNTANNNGWTFSTRSRGGGTGAAGGEGSATPNQSQGGGGQGGGGCTESCGGQGGGQGGGGQGGGGDTSSLNTWIKPYGFLASAIESGFDFPKISFKKYSPMLLFAGLLVF